MSRQLGLFVGATLSEDQLEGLISPLYPQLWRMIREPFDDLVGRRANDSAFRLLDEGESAQWLRPQIVAKATDILGPRSDVRLEKRHGQFLINYKNEVAITPKKFRKKWLSTNLTFSSYPTDQNTQYWGQCPVGGFEPIPRIIVGYRFVHLMTDIQILVAYPKGKELRLCYLMPDQSGVVFAQEVAQTAQIASEADKGFQVIPKQAQKSSRAAE